MPALAPLRDRFIKPLVTKSLAVGVAALALLAAAPAANAFCGFFVAKADGELFNEASKVVMVRDRDRTVLTMVNDYQGDPQEFAMVIPTPVVLKKEQVHVAENALVEHLDAFTAPRLVEYFDEDPCRPMVREMMKGLATAASAPPMMDMAAEAEALGVTIEEQYTVGEYDILILSAKESDGLQTWLDQNGYQTPEKARKVLASYIAQDMKFFVAKVNLAEKTKLGGEFLRPLQLAYESDKFMLPIRLGTVNAKGKQDLLLFTLTRNGRVETQNYRTVKIPSNLDVPLFVQKEFGDFYKAAFATAVEREGGRAVITEYAWDMGWCDPCAADPLSVSELQELGVFWLSGGGGQAIQPRPGGGVDAYVTRLHLRYDAETFPEDLRLHATGDKENFQGRYVMRHPWKGEMSCPQATQYLRELAKRFEREAQNLANITGWEIADIRTKMKASGEDPSDLPDVGDGDPWWKKIWKD